MTIVEYERRFKTRIVERLLAPLSEAELAKLDAEDLELWDLESATEVADAEWEAESDRSEGPGAGGFEDDPEGAADECLSCWSD